MNAVGGCFKWEVNFSHFLCLYKGRWKKGVCLFTQSVSNGEAEGVQRANGAESRIQKENRSTVNFDGDLSL